MEVAALIVAVVSLVASTWTGVRQWKRDGWLVRCEWAWEYPETPDGQRLDNTPHLVIKAVNFGRAPVQVRAYGLIAGGEDLGEIWGEIPDVYGPSLPRTLDGGHMIAWMGVFGDPSGKSRSLRPYVVLGTNQKVKAKKNVGPPLREG